MRPCKAVLFTDGACRPNPGFGGSGVYGYTYAEATRPKNIKHPTRPNLHFTTTGFSTTKDETPIEVLSIIEMVIAINNSAATNNEAELLAMIHALKKASSIEGLTELTIYTDSNYVVSSFNENLDKWKLNDWKRLDGKTIIHMNEWLTIDNYKKAFDEAKITVNAIWVKGHSDNHGNIVSDELSIIGSNSARRQLSNPDIPFNEIVLDSVLSYADYKKSFPEKDIVFFYRDLYFSSNEIDDTNYCFLGIADSKKDTSRILTFNTGFVPKIISELKAIYRRIPRTYVATCSIKLNKLDNKDLHRLAHIVNIEDLLIRQVNGSCVTYNLVGDTTPFLFENTTNLPFIVKANRVFEKTLDIATGSAVDLITADVTDSFIKDKKLIITNKQKSLDFSDLVKGKITLKQRLLLSIGDDMPGYLALKHIEADILKVSLVVETSPNDNFCTAYINIETANRNILSVNICNRYLKSNLVIINDSI